jgi:molybdopterin synthase sulfur carrier subunit
MHFLKYWKEKKGGNMAVKVRIPAPLKKFTGGKGIVEARGQDILEVINDLEGKYPGIKERIYDGEGIRLFINVFLNDEDIRFLGGEKARVKDGDTISIIPAISGGRRKKWRYSHSLKNR